MIIIPVKDGESIDRALKKFKKKFNMTGTMKQLRARREFTKKSVALRDQKIRAAYKETLRREED
ncbi:30S ribosomal protein S21 [Flavobacteriales bacterium]|jgi:small subunit ribosomal protein S21|nr:30S ribosomal protein S21 [Flavobacteriales bacterium]|tara:strand:+ start:185 stop:376 length:192 start_codon:yes stop_codon:yes gene_type:complete